MRERRHVWLLGAAVLLSYPADAREWVSVPGESRLSFAFRFDGEEMRGEFTRFEVDWDQTPEHGATLEVTVEVGSADLSSRELNEGVTDPEWFHTARFPRAEFRSTSVTERAAGEFEIHGALKLKGISQPLQFDLRWRADGDRGRMTGTAEVRRLAHDIGSGEWADDDTVGQAVRVEYDVTLEPRG